MSAPKQCPQCGGELAADDLGGHCPRCLVSKTLFEPLANEEAGWAGLAPRQVGDYELIEEIARGGMGIVYRARQISLNRTVALKMILAGEFATPESVRRFRNEAEAAARLRHPNIVTIHQVDEQDDQHYFVMELVDGPNFAALVRDGPLPGRRAATYLKAVAEAVAHAHSQRILHRDLKPSNILLDPFDQPKVTDFGLARQLDIASDLTLSGQAFGSPGYMPPEQAIGGGKVTEASDLYSLGAVLYHLLTGRPPFQGETVHAVLKQVETAEPLPPCRLNPSVPLDLETICLKCLDKDPERRYASGQELADELGRFLRDEPIRARRLSRLARGLRWVWRHPAVSILGVSVLLLLVVVAVGSSIAAWRVATARRAEFSERQKAEVANRDLLGANQRLMETVRLLELRRAEDLFRANDSAQGVASLASILRRDPSNHIAASRLVSALVHGHWVLPAAPSMRHSQPVESVTFSPDGRQVLTVSRDAYARIWDASTGKPLLMLRHNDRVHSARYSPDGTQIVTASSDATSRIWWVTNGTELATLPHKGKVTWAEFSPDGRNLLTVSDRVVRVWDSSNGSLQRELKGHTRLVSLARYSSDGTKIASGSDMGSLRIWDANSGELIFQLSNQMARVISLEFSPNGRRLVWAGDAGVAQLWDPIKGIPVGGQLMNGDRNDQVWRATFSADSRLLLTASQDGWARLWDAETGHLLEQRFRHEGGVTFGAFSPDGRTIVTSSTDNTSRLWDVRTGMPLCQPLREHERVLQAAFSPDGLKLVTGSYDWNVQVWDIRSRATVGTRIGEGVRSLVFSPDDKTVLASARRAATLYEVDGARPAGPPLVHPALLTSAAYNKDSTRAVTIAGDSARVFDLRSGRVVAGPLVHGDAIRAACFNPSGDRVLTCSADGTARIWNADTGQPAVAPLVHRAEIITASFSHDGRKVVTASEDHSAQIWDADTGRPLGAPMTHLDHLKSAEFSPDDQRIVTASTDNTACIWDVATSRPVAPLLRHARIVEKAAFSPDGRRVVTGSLDLTARVWDAGTGQALTQPLKHGSPVGRVCFAPDGRRIATGCWSGAVRVWDVETGLPLTEWLDSGGAVTSLHFDSIGNRLATAARGGRIWDLPVAPMPVPGWFPALAEAIGGLRLGARGNAEFVSRQDLEEFGTKLAELPSDEFYARVGRWLLADPGRRAASPF
jgi:WD40 repeat protein